MKWPLCREFDGLQVGICRSLECFVFYTCLPFWINPMARKLIICTTALCFAITYGWAQLNLDFHANQSQEIDGRFKLEVSPTVLDEILKITGEKMTVNPISFTFNNQLLDIKSCKTRGNTTLKFRRKSFSISLNKPLQQSMINKLAINNLAMDRNYWRSRLCFLLMKQIGIFPLQNQYAELILNGQTQGTYLMIQKPDDFTRFKECKLLVRRGDGSKISIEYAETRQEKKVAKILKNTHELPKVLSGKPLSDSLNTILDMEHYNKWLAFNFLIMNGDYYDELFLYLDPETNRFDIIPWDYDDIFSSGPHEGIKKRNQVLGDRLLFSSEASFDQAIAKDNLLYTQYLQDFEVVLSTLTPEVLKENFEKVYGGLYPYFANSKVIAQSEYDQAGLTSLSLLEEDLNNYFQFLIRRRVKIINTIASQLNLSNQ